ncbi:nucleotidyl transferase AbiEii/AbiGii toxin family protein [Streptacidiphilus sp. MAP5-3]
MTRDIDILGLRFPGERDEIVRRITAIASLEIDDGVVFEGQSIKTVPIREDDEYHGLRLAMAATIARARLKLQLDVSFGDPITPGPEPIAYQQQLSNETFQLLGYPIVTVIAEKLTTALSLGAFNTRDRDYADLYRLFTLHEFDSKGVASALDATAAHRGIRLQRLSPLLLPDYSERRQSSYAAWRRRQGPVATVYPERFGTVVEVVTAFADPLLDGSGSVPGRTWSPETRAWG